MFKTSNISKYLTRYAEPEANIVAPAGLSYAFAVVVPARGETEQLLQRWTAMLDGGTPERRVLFIVVINSDAQTQAAHLAANGSLLTALLRRPHQRLKGPVPAWLVFERRCDILVIDRHSTGHTLPPKTGVGLARKVGSDVACAWVARGVITCPWWLSTDADATLPRDLTATWASLPSQPGVGCLPFEHVTSGELAVDFATFAVEVRLRYHVLGLRHAGSAYAWPALGSCLTVHAEVYAAVRGFPKRVAGEDFYLLEKASKVAPVYDLEGAPIRIHARRSERAPFGTGQSVNELLRSGDVETAFELRHPACYVWLKELLQRVESTFDGGDVASFHDWVNTVNTGCTSDVANGVTTMGVEAALKSVIDATLDAETRRRRFRDWFDGLKQIQLLKHLERTFPSLPYQEALRLAPFTELLTARDLPTAVHALRQCRAASHEAWAMSVKASP